MTVQLLPLPPQLLSHMDRRLPQSIRVCLSFQDVTPSLASVPVRAQVAEFRMTTAESEARKALNRLRRAVEKAQREIVALEGALARAEGPDFPADLYEGMNLSIRQLLDFTEEEATRLQEKILHSGGLEAGRVRRG